MRPRFSGGGFAASVSSLSLEDSPERDARMAGVFIFERRICAAWQVHFRSKIHLNASLAQQSFGNDQLKIRIKRASPAPFPELRMPENLFLSRTVGMGKELFPTARTGTPPIRFLRKPRSILPESRENGPRMSAKSAATFPGCPRRRPARARRGRKAQKTPVPHTAEWHIRSNAGFSPRIPGRP